MDKLINLEHLKSGLEAVKTLISEVLSTTTSALEELETSKAETVHTHQASEVTFTDKQTFQDKLDNGSLKGPQGQEGKAGAAGARGSTWTTGTDLTGTESVSGTVTGSFIKGDMYLNTGTGLAYTYNGSAWTYAGNLKGAQGAAGQNGAAGPNAVSGSTTTTLTGLLKGDGTKVTTATSGTDYAAGNHTHNYAGSTTAGGAANTATKLATAQNLAVALGSTTAVTFDGSAAQKSIPVSGTLQIANGGTGKTTASESLSALGGQAKVTNGTATVATTNWADNTDTGTNGTYKFAASVTATGLTVNDTVLVEIYGVGPWEAAAKAGVASFADTAANTIKLYAVSKPGADITIRWVRIPG